MGRNGMMSSLGHTYTPLERPAICDDLAKAGQIGRADERNAACKHPASTPFPPGSAPVTPGLRSQ